MVDTVQIPRPSNGALLLRCPPGLGGFTREWGCRPRRVGLEPVPLGASCDRHRLASDRLS